MTRIPDTKKDIAMPRKHAEYRYIMPGLVLAACVAFAGFALAQSAEPVSPKLTPKLQDLLRKEMLSVNEASQEILAAMVTGDDERVATLAQQIHDSFILRQSMTPEDKADLMAAVPEDFVRMDRNFHEISAALAEAANAKNRPPQRERFGQMIDACVACHSKYASDRFPAFSE
ncbi:cytochrome c [Iodidimonas muriae]|nr:cytochrome c [Iodidimonas muriae]